MCRRVGLAGGCQEEKMKEAQFEWGRGAVQKEETQQRIDELRAMADVSGYDAALAMNLTYLSG